MAEVAAIQILVKNPERILLRIIFRIRIHMICESTCARCMSIKLLWRTRTLHANTSVLPAAYLLCVKRGCIRVHALSFFATYARAISMLFRWADTGDLVLCAPRLVCYYNYIWPAKRLRDELQTLRRSAEMFLSPHATVVKRLRNDVNVQSKLIWRRCRCSRNNMTQLPSLCTAKTTNACTHTYR